jgi:hypothetical protein
MKTEYNNVTFRVRTRICGSTVGALSSKDGIKLTRVTDAGRDDLLVVTSRGACEVPWTNIASAQAGPAKVKAKA